MVVVGIPFYHFFIYPFFLQLHSYNAKRIGIGLVLLHCSFLMSAIVGNILLCGSHINVTCLFFYSEILNMSSNGFWWDLFLNIAYNLGLFLSLIALLEFVFAQTPRSIRGLMTGLIVLSTSVSSCIGYGVYKLVSVIFSYIDKWFISDISLAVTSAVRLILFVSFSKRYKLRWKGWHCAHPSIC